MAFTMPFVNGLYSTDLTLSTDDVVEDGFLDDIACDVTCGTIQIPHSSSLAGSPDGTCATVESTVLLGWRDSLDNLGFTTSATNTVKATLALFPIFASQQGSDLFSAKRHWDHSCAGVVYRRPIFVPKIFCAWTCVSILLHAMVSRV